MAHVLLIEPDLILVKTYRAALERAGHSVAAVHSAQLALDKADENLPDVIILELQLSNHNGVEFLYELRSYPEWANIPIVILSNVPPPETGSDKKIWEQLGVVNYLYKPQTKLSQLVDLVNDVVPA